MDSNYRYLLRFVVVILGDCPGFPPGDSEAVRHNCILEYKLIGRQRGRGRGRKKDEEKKNGELFVVQLENRTGNKP